MKILGILNITEDSFSDGGKFLAPEAALAHGLKLLEEAPISWISARRHPIPTPGGSARNRDRAAAIGAARASPEGRGHFHRQFRCPVQRWALGEGVDYLNDIHGFAEPALYPELAAAKAKLIVMHAIQERRHRHPGRCAARARFLPAPSPSSKNG